MTLPNDAHYSPPWVAKCLVDLVPDLPDLTVFDPAAGEGALLDALAQRMSRAAIIGADIDRATVRELRYVHPSWRLGVADMFNPRSRARSLPWRLAREIGVDIVVMNPPFSFRGYAGEVIEYAGRRYNATPAVAFVATAIQELRPRLGLYAILPRGAIDGERDRELWSSIARRHSLRVHGELPRGSFPSAAATTLLVSLSPAPTTPRLMTSMPPVVAQNHACSCVEIVRGRLPAAIATSAATGLIPWLHTRDVRESQAIARWVDLPRAAATPGPLLVVPRVGKFNLGKLAIVARPRIALSDCLYGLRRPQGDLEGLLKMLQDSVDSLGARYFGTGAPHITIPRLVEHLRSLGFSPRHVSADGEPESCWCSSDSAQTGDDIELGLSHN